MSWYFGGAWDAFLPESGMGRFGGLVAWWLGGLVVVGLLGWWGVQCLVARQWDGVGCWAVGLLGCWVGGAGHAFLPGSGMGWVAKLLSCWVAGLLG